MPRRAKRYLFFTITILVGIAAGVAFGWTIDPLHYTNTGPHTLRMDYKTDYVLMVSVLYQSDSDIAMALARLAYLGEDDPLALVRAAIVSAENNQYDPADLQRMQNLQSALQVALPGVQ